MNTFMLENLEARYLQFDDLDPEVLEELRLRGLTKLLLSRFAVIHYKHLLTEVFVRKNRTYLDIIEQQMTLEQYATFITNRIRRVLKMPRIIELSPAEVSGDISSSLHRFLNRVLVAPLKTAIGIDFDNTITRYPELYLYLHERVKKHPNYHRLYIISANHEENIKNFLKKRNLPFPSKILGGKKEGKVNAMMYNLICPHFFSIFIDDQIEYCQIAHVFGAHAYRVNGKTEDGFAKLKKITMFSS